MTATRNIEQLEINGTFFEIGEQIEQSPQAILSLEGLHQLVVTRRVDVAGKPLTMLSTAEPIQLPLRPSDHELKINFQKREEYYHNYSEYLRILQNRIEVPVPPVVGHVETCKSETYYHLNQLDRLTTSILPYQTNNMPHNLLYKLELVQITY